MGEARQIDLTKLTETALDKVAKQKGLRIYSAESNTIRNDFMVKCKQIQGVLTTILENQRSKFGRSGSVANGMHIAGRRMLVHRRMSHSQDSERLCKPLNLMPNDPPKPVHKPFLRKHKERLAKLRKNPVPIRVWNSDAYFACKDPPTIPTPSKDQVFAKKKSVPFHTKILHRRSVSTSIPLSPCPKCPTLPQFQLQPQFKALTECDKKELYKLMESTDFQLFIKKEALAPKKRESQFDAILKIRNLQFHSTPKAEAASHFNEEKILLPMAMKSAESVEPKPKSPAEPAIPKNPLNSRKSNTKVVLELPRMMLSYNSTDDTGK